MNLVQSPERRRHALRPGAAGGQRPADVVASYRIAHPHRVRVIGRVELRAQRRRAARTEAAA